MKVVYLSKALVVAEYRRKLSALSRGAEIVAVIPERWGRNRREVAEEASDARLLFHPVWMHGSNHFHLYPRLAALLDFVRPDLVHIDEEPYSAVTFHTAVLCRRRAIPCLFFAWQNLPKRLPPPFGAARRSVFRTVAGGIAGTPAAARVLRAAGFDGPLAVLPQFGVDPERFRQDASLRRETRKELNISDDEFLIGFGGRLAHEKGIHLLLQALAGLPAARLLIMGDGPERDKLMAVAGRLGVLDRTIFRGSIPSSGMPAALTALDVLALPSLATSRWKEQFGRILVEAMACGVAVVGSRSGEIPHVVGEAGVLFPEGDADSLTEALRMLAADPAARRRYADAGRQRVISRFTNDRVAGDTLAFYSALLPRAE